MQARPILLLALSVGALAAFSDTAPSTTRYRVDITRDQVLDLTALGQPARSQHQFTSAFVTVALADTAGGHSVGFRIDSLQVDSALHIPPEAVDSTRGASATAFLADGGVTSGITTVKDGPLAAGIFPILHHFFPRVRAGAKVGSTWTDTLDFSSSPGAATVSVRMVANWAVMGDETKNGESTRKVQEAYSLAQSGQITSAQGTLSLSGTGTGTATYWVTPDGRMVAQQMAESLSSTLSSPDLPAPIPVTSKTGVTTATLK